jgi:5'-methylthioadenosine phosphorylase
MTGYPEAILARELGLCYTAIALVTDLDAGIDAETAFSHADVLRVFAENVEKLRHLLGVVVGGMPTTRSCVCVHAHDGLELPFELPDPDPVG